jgi:hypothetical protein
MIPLIGGPGKSVPISAIYFYAYMLSSTISYFLFLVLPPQCLLFRRQAENLSNAFRTCTNTTFSESQDTTKFPNAIAIKRNPNDSVIGVSCNTDASHDGGKRIVIVVNKAAIVIVAMKGTRSECLRTYHSRASVAEKEDRH